MTLSPGEFLRPSEAKIAVKYQVLAGLYYIIKHQGHATVSSEELRVLLRRAGIPGAAGMNISAHLSQLPGLVDIATVDARTNRWLVTKTGENKLRELGMITSESVVEREVQDIRAKMVHIGSPEVRAFLEEAIRAYAVGCNKAAVVFLWVGAVRTLQEKMLLLDGAHVTKACRKHDARCPEVKSVDDFSYIKESHLLLAAEDLGIIDKARRQVLGHCLDLRNKCGHPTQYNPGERKVAAFIEDIIPIVFG